MSDASGHTAAVGSTSPGQASSPPGDETEMGKAQVDGDRGAAPAPEIKVGDDRVKPTRDQREVLRLSAAEKAAIKRFADVYGLAPSTYVRQAALGQLPPLPSIEPTRVSTVDVRADPAAEGLSTAFPLEVKHTGMSAPRVEAEVEEAKLEDDPARAAFIERRTKELFGQGKTTRRAEWEAAEEWKQRGA